MLNDRNIKRRCWTYWIGIALRATQPFLMMSYAHPLILGAVSIVCLGLLIGGLFVCAASDLGFIVFLIRIVFTCFLILVTGAVRFQVAFALVQEKSCDEYVGRVVAFSLVLALCALVYGGVRFLRNYRRKRRLLSVSAG